MADISTPQINTPLQAAIDRLAAEAQFVNESLHINGPGKLITFNAQAMRWHLDGLTQVLSTMRALQAQAPVVPVVPAVGGTPAGTVGG